MSLTDEQLLAIQRLIVEPVDRANRESIAEIREMLASHTSAQDKRIADHESRISGLESVKRKALVVWTFIVFVATVAAKYVYDEWIRPVLGIK